MWTTKLKNKKRVTLRFLNAEDKEKLFHMFSSMSKEALKWSNTPFTMDVIQEWIDDITNLIAIVVEYRKKIVGFGFIKKCQHVRREGVGDLTIYLHQDFQKIGLGTYISRNLLDQAKKENMHKIEHYIVAKNEAALYLYKKVGFEIEGVSSESFIDINGEYQDLIQLGLILK
jgi:L-amino acid N-acyltransferase YncA